MVSRSTGWTVDGSILMEKSGRQIAIEAFQEEKIDCQIADIRSDGTSGGHWCFVVDVTLDQENAEKWDKVFG